MIKSFTAFICVLIGFTSFAQNIKTGVVVIGSSPSGYAAAIQSAKSGVKTVFIDAGKFESIVLSEADRAIKAGIYADFIKHIDSLQKSPFRDNQTLLPAFTAQVFKGWADTVKNLTVLPNSSIKSIKKSGKGWELNLNGREIKADVILDATKNNMVAKMAGLVINKKQAAIPASGFYSDKKYRTSVGVMKNDAGLFKTVSLSSLIVPEIENLVLAAPVGEPSTILTGQAAGAIAAYCVFFKTTTKTLNVRLIQTELLSYRTQLIKFADIADADSSMIAFQHIGVTGILKAKESDGRLFFIPDSAVSTEELKQPLREYYSRSQIWFLDNKADRITLETALSLIKFLGSRGRELNNEVEQAWKKSLRLNGEFDLKRVITRRELAILLDTYLQPYTVAVDLEGNVKS